MKKMLLAGLVTVAALSLANPAAAGGFEGCVNNIQYWWNGDNPTVRFTVGAQIFTFKGTEITVGITNDALTPQSRAAWQWLIDTLRAAQAAKQTVKVAWFDGPKRVSSIETLATICH